MTEQKKLEDKVLEFRSVAADQIYMSDDPLRKLVLFMHYVRIMMCYYIYTGCQKIRNIPYVGWTLFFLVTPIWLPIIVYMAYRQHVINKGE